MNIALRLTLPKLHLATSNSSSIDELGPGASRLVELGDAWQGRRNPW